MSVSKLALNTAGACSLKAAGLFRFGLGGSRLRDGDGHRRAPAMAPSTNRRTEHLHGHDLLNLTERSMKDKRVFYQTRFRTEPSRERRARTGSARRATVRSADPEAGEPNRATTDVSPAGRLSLRLHPLDKQRVQCGSGPSRCRGASRCRSRHSLCEGGLQFADRAFAVAERGQNPRALVEMLSAQERPIGRRESVGDLLRFVAGAAAPRRRSGRP